MNRAAKGFLALLLLCVPLGVFAADLLYIKGSVELLDEDGKVRKIGTIGDALVSGETISVGEQSRALVKNKEGVISVLTENSQMRVEEAGFFDHLRGAVYYVLGKLPSAAESRGRGYGVTTTVATLGIRGTRFLVDMDGERGQVVLTEGLVSVQANEGKSFSIDSYPDGMTFEEFQTVQKALFDSHQKEDFKSYQERQKKAFERFKQEFFIQPNQSVSFDGEEVSYQGIGDEAASLIAELDALVRKVEADLTVVAE